MKDKYESGELVAPFVPEESRRRSAEKNRKFWKSSKSEDMRKAFSDRMKENNPMYDPSVAEKVGLTLSKNHKDGKYNWPKGIDHWLWKGNRGFFAFVRSRLYRPWTLEVFKRDDFTCIKCGKTNCELHAHHIRAFRDIASFVLKRKDIDINQLDKIQDQWEDLASLIIEAHTLEDGISVCVDCHGDLDERYRRHRKKKDED